MRPTRREVLAGMGALAISACGGPGTGPEPTPAPTSPPDPREAALAAAVRWLESRQVDDGSFPSDMYGFWRLGQTTTGFVLLALMRAGTTEPSRIDRGVAALLRMRGADGALGFAGVVPDYPTYASAFAASVLRERRPEEAGPTVSWLLSQQFRAGGGWEGHPAQGGWGMGSRFELAPPQAGHVDISMTRRVLEALPADFEGRPEALAFVRRCRGEDGGFFYSPVDPSLNKGLTDRMGYGTATADGILALLALGIAADDPEVEAPLDFLRGLHESDVNPGVAGGPRDPYAPAMRFSYRAGAAQVFARLGGPPGWQQGVTGAVVREQAADGSFRNESNLQKEDEPLVATAFAVETLVFAA